MEDDWLEKVTRTYEAALLMSIARESVGGTVRLIQRLTTTMPNESYQR